MCYTLPMGKKLRKIYVDRMVLLLLAVVLAAAGLGACSPIREFLEVAEKISQPLPSADNTLTSLVEVTQAMQGAMERGETEFTFNAADIDEDSLKNIGNLMSTFWGKPVSYSINSEFKGIEGIIDGRGADIRNITNEFELSNNYYIYNHVKNGAPIPEGMRRAKEIAAALPYIAAEVFTGSEASGFELTLAVHDWLVANIDYDDKIPVESDENGTYGAIILRRTMCLGYAEALELLLRCYTDVEVTQVVGEAMNLNRYNESLDTWNGHAWNAVRLGGNWHQIDATFNDPLGSPSGRLSHLYFGQSDAFMSKNHRWERDFFPVSNMQDFLYFRQSGLFAEDWDEFEAILTELLSENEGESIEFIEIAVRNDSINEDNIQFVYSVLDGLEELWWSEQVWNGIHVHSIEFLYESA